MNLMTKNGVKRAIDMRVMIALLAAFCTQEASADITYVHSDHLGSPVAYTDAMGNVIGREHYTPYGESLNPPTTDDTVSFTGHVRDGDTGLVYMQARYYDPEIGRFLSIDPVTISPDQLDHFNRYWYANGNPMVYVDPDGGNAIRAGQLALRGGLIVGAAAYAAVDDNLQAMLPDPKSAPSATEVIVVTMVAEALDVVAGTNVLSESADQVDNDTATPSGECQNCGGETTSSTGKIATETGLSSREVKDKIHGVKAGQLGTGDRKNPDVEVCTTCGETYPKVEDGKLGDSIGNIHDF